MELELKSEMYTFTQLELSRLLEDLRHKTLTSITIGGKKSFADFITVVRRGKVLIIPIQNIIEKDMVVMESQGTIKLLKKVDEVVTNKTYMEFKEDFPSFFNDLVNSYEESYAKEVNVLLDETQKALLVLKNLVNSFKVMRVNLFYDEFEKGKKSLDERYVKYLETYSHYSTLHEIGVSYVSDRYQVTNYLNERYNGYFKRTILAGVEDNLVSQLSYLKGLKVAVNKSLRKAFKLNLDIYLIYKRTGRIKPVKDLYELLDDRCGRELREMVLRLESLEEIYPHNVYLGKLKQAYLDRLARDYGYVYIDQFN